MRHAPAPLPAPPRQNINLPLTGDDAAIKKYASDVEALKKQIGMPDVEDVRRRRWGCCWGAAALQAAGSRRSRRRCSQHAAGRRRQGAGP